MGMNNKEEAVQLFKSVLTTVNPREFLSNYIKWNPEIRTLSIFEKDLTLADDQKIFVIGTGKASATMAAAAENIFGDDLVSGLIISPPESDFNSEKIQVAEGSHPLPDSKSSEATEQLIRFAGNIPENSVVINLISGGTSSLFCSPAEPLTIDEIREIYDLLIQSGATIHEINTVRKIFSKVKGGQFLNHLNHTILIDMVISDVPDDDIRYIGSGPTAAQNISASEAYDVLKKYAILEKLPKNARQYISREKENEEIKGEPRKTSDFENHYCIIVSSASKVAKNTVHVLKESGYSTTLVDEAWSGPVGEFEAFITENLDDILKIQIGKTALVFYGECTVEVTGSGLGGRNQELALRMAKRLMDYEKQITFLSAGTDGIDGPTDAAGAVVDQSTYHEAMENGINPDTYLENNDSYHFFEKIGGHVKTGPTGNNVMDIQILLIDP